MELPPQLRHATPVEVSERLRAERAGRPFLLLRDGEGRQRIVDLGGEARSLSVGRDAGSDVALEWDSEVSRVHAVLERVGSVWTLADEGLSRNGSFVDGQRVHGRRRLEPGDVIRVGQTVMVFASGAEGAPGAAETRPQAPPPELSPAQRRVLEALCRPWLSGASAAPAGNREIAEALVVSDETVKSHMRALFAAFGLAGTAVPHKRAELARRAVAAGVVRRGKAAV
jgi:pSer/pThr/pTyr-binding forkhead associated (FHA) protein